ncbi:MAG: hypothetical protein WC340_03330 [Kiritimatiellia bacterium]
MAAWTLLLKLERVGLSQLPPRPQPTGCAWARHGAVRAMTASAASSPTVLFSFPRLALIRPAPNYWDVRLITL